MPFLKKKYLEFDFTEKLKFEKDRNARVRMVEKFTNSSMIHLHTIF